MAKYTLIYSILVETIAIITFSVLVISKRIKRAVVKWVLLWLCVLLQIEVLIGGGKRNNIGRDSASIKLYGY